MLMWGTQKELPLWCEKGRGCWNKCGIPSRELFQNGGDACEESCTHGVCARAGAQNAGRLGEAGGPLRLDTAQAEEAGRLPNVGGGNSA